ncbi:hypothetical protein [Flavobacterium suzhouense]|uniref:Uncharacterized protein n=1 Tax=Flavobacterium suzhouense TaxID=1529638 RepID=A0ABW5NTF5_9FLAO
MDYRLILEKATSNLQNYPEVIEEIKDCITLGSTGGEIISRLGKYLKDLPDKNIKAYSLIEKDAVLYLKVCESNGYLIK